MILSCLYLYASREPFGPACWGVAESSYCDRAAMTKVRKQIDAFVEAAAV